MKKYRICLTQIGYFSQFVEVEAEDEDDAGYKAIDAAGDSLWTLDCLSEYNPTVNFVEEINESN